MVWTSGAIAKFEPTRAFFERLKRHLTTKRDEAGRELTSTIQLDREQITLDKETSIISGMIFDQWVNYPYEIVENNGVFSVEKKERVETRWTKFWMTTKSIVVIETPEAKTFAIRALNQSIGLGAYFISPIVLDVNRIATDYRGQWYGSLSGRAGNVHTGSFYGDEIEDDAEFGSGYASARGKTAVGINTDYFGIRTKVKLTRAGTVIVFGQVGMPQFIEFVRNVVMSYA